MAKPEEKSAYQKYREEREAARKAAKGQTETPPSAYSEYKSKREQERAGAPATGKQAALDARNEQIRTRQDLTGKAQKAIADVQNIQRKRRVEPVERAAGEAGRAQLDQGPITANPNAAYSEFMLPPDAQRGMQAEREVYRDKGVTSSVDAATIRGLNSAALGIPGIVNKDFRGELAAAGNDQPGASMGGDIAGFMAPSIGLWNTVRAPVNALARPFIPRGADAASRTVRYGAPLAGQISGAALTNAGYRAAVDEPIRAESAGEDLTIGGMANAAAQGLKDPLNLIPLGLSGTNRIWNQLTSGIATPSARAAQMANQFGVGPRQTAASQGIAQTTQELGGQLQGADIRGLTNIENALRFALRDNRNIPDVNARIATGFQRIRESLPLEDDPTLNLARLIEREFAPDAPQTRDIIRRFLLKVGMDTPGGGQIVGGAANQMRGQQADVLRTELESSFGAQPKTEAQAALQESLDQFSAAYNNVMPQAPRTGPQAEEALDLLIGSRTNQLPPETNLQAILYRRAQERNMTVDNYILQNPLEALHWVQSDLADQARSLRAANAPDANLERVVQNMQRPLRDALPEYGELQNLWRQYSQALGRLGYTRGAEAGVKAELSTVPGFGDKIFGPGGIAKSEMGTQTAADVYLQMDDLSQRAAGLSVRDVINDELRKGKAAGLEERYQTAANMRRVATEGGLDALRRVFGEAGDRVARRIEQFMDANEFARNIDPEFNSATMNKAQAMQTGAQPFAGPMGQATQSAAGSLGQNAVGDAFMMASGITSAPVLSAIRAVPWLANRLQPSARTQRNIAETLLRRGEIGSQVPPRSGGPAPITPIDPAMVPGARPPPGGNAPPQGSPIAGNGVHASIMSGLMPSRPPSFVSAPDQGMRSALAGGATPLPGTPSGRTVGQGGYFGRQSMRPPGSGPSAREIETQQQWATATPIVTQARTTAQSAAQAADAALQSKAPADIARAKDAKKTLVGQLQEAQASRAGMDTPEDARLAETLASLAENTSDPVLLSTQISAAKTSLDRLLTDIGSPVEGNLIPVRTNILTRTQAPRSAAEGPQDRASVTRYAAGTDEVKPQGFGASTPTRVDLSDGYNRLTRGSAEIEYTVHPGGRLEIESMYVDPASRGKGEASRALDDMLAAADARGLKVDLTVDPLEDGGMTQRQLEAFYKSRGFVSDGADGMVRPPPSAPQQPARFETPGSPEGGNGVHASIMSDLMPSRPPSFVRTPDQGMRSALAKGATPLPGPGDNLIPPTPPVSATGNVLKTPQQAARMQKAKDAASVRLSVGAKATAALDSGNNIPLRSSPADMLKAIDDQVRMTSDEKQTFMRVFGDQIRMSRGEAAAFFKTAADPRNHFSHNVEGFGAVAQRMTDEEIQSLSAATAPQVVKILEDLRRITPVQESAAVAVAGGAKKGWYLRSQKALQQVFGDDAPRFASVLAALSPQTSVESNLANAVSFWTNWTKAQRPTDEASILKILGQSVQGDKGDDSVLGAWRNNAVRAIQTANAEDALLSGPKVDSFRRNLRARNAPEAASSTGQPGRRGSGSMMDDTEYAVTNDAWMANYFNVDQELFARGGGKSQPGYSPGYLATNVYVREVAEHLSKVTGERWTPREVQETIWSWAKTLYEARGAGGETRSAAQLVGQKALTDLQIGGTPDFAILLKDNPDLRAVLKEAGYEQQIDNLTGASGAVYGDAPGFLGVRSGPQDATGSGFGQRDYERRLGRAAGRLDDLAKRRATAAREERVRTTRLALAGDGAAPRAYARGSGGDGQTVRFLGQPVAATYTPERAYQSAYAKNQIDMPDVHELPANVKAGATYAKRMQEAAARSKFGAAVNVYSPEEYAGMRLFVAADGKSGFALKGDDIVSVWSDPKGPSGRTDALLPLAVQMGGRRLDAFDTVLPDIYAKHGFRIESRLGWNDEFAPTGWDKGTYARFNNGEPDVVFMVWDPAYKGAPRATDGVRATTYEEALATQSEAQKAIADRIALEYKAPEQPERRTVGKPKASQSARTVGKAKTN
jgi:ribosomal protein S18 acetylase RimI-like enzyme